MARIAGIILATTAVALFALAWAAYTPTCEDVSHINFGQCSTYLGWGMNSNGECYQVRGCNQDALNRDNKRLWMQDGTCQQNCANTCSGESCYQPSCTDVGSHDWGSGCSRPTVLGWGYVSGECKEITGCNQESLYAVDTRLWKDKSTCQDNCVRTPSTSYSPTCVDMSKTDFGSCSSGDRKYLGWGIINGQCERISGCNQDSLHKNARQLWSDKNNCDMNCKPVDCGNNADYCNDGNGCTTDSCKDGQCYHDQISCSDYDLCTDDYCRDGHCRHTPKDCSDGDFCTDDNCQEGECYHKKKDCSDGDPCTTDSCRNGQCVHTRRDVSGCRE